jgi:hypothetical protein
MAIAGRVAIVPKGEWSQSVTYDKLDLVTYNGNTFIAYKSSVGVTPVDGDTWMLVMQGIDPQDIENIIDGTTPVGDSNKLGGKGASEYALDADLANYLPNTGGTVNGNLILSAKNNGNTPLTVEGNSTSYNWSLIDFKASGERVGYLGFDAKNKPTYHSATNPSKGHELLHSGNVGSYALPITGGTVSNSGGIPLTLQGSNVSYVKFTNSSGTQLGLLGAYTDGSPVYSDGSTVNKLLHTGNKPTGSYTGNGSATARTISTGGIGSVIYVQCSNMGYQAIVGATGGIQFDSDGNVTGLKITEAKFANGVLTIATTAHSLNSNGKAITYQVL